MMDLFLKDENGLYGHVFISNDSETCDICDERKESHQLIENPVKIESIQQSFILEKSEDEPRHTCEICYIEFVRSEFVIISGKLHTICTGCMNSYLKHEIMTLQVEKIQCPHCG